MAGNSTQVQSVLSTVYSTIRLIGSVVVVVTNLVWLTNRLIRSIIALRAINQNDHKEEDFDG